MPIDIKTLTSLANNYAPQIHLNKHELYYPAPIDWYLPKVDLLAQDGSLITSVVDENALSTANSSDHLKMKVRSIDSEQGDLTNAPYYVRITDVANSPGMIDIQYWFFYAFNGCSAVGADILDIITKVIEVPPLGEHQGDWEHVTVRINGNSSDNELVGVYTAQHGWGKWHKKNEYNKVHDTVRPSLYSALHTHATYDSPGIKKIKAIGPTGFDIGLLDQVDKKGQIWDPLSTGAGIDLVSVNVTGVDFSDAPWTNFQGHWGPPTDEKETVTTATKDLVDALNKIKSGLGDNYRQDIAAAMTTAFGVFLPGGPSSPSAKKSWQEGESTSP